MELSDPRAIVNREDPTPTMSISIPPAQGQRLGAEARYSAASKPNEKSQGTGTSGRSSTSFQDRLFSSLFQQIVPTQEVFEVPVKPDKHSKKNIDRPNFSLPVMSNNFRRFNARIGVVFVFQNKLTKVLSWKTPMQTISLLAVYTFCCLDPNLIAIMPLIACLFFVMVPAFYARHPPPPNSKVTDAYEGHGPALAPPPSIKPAPDMSKDFFRNMRDLQNCMEDFSVIHDQLVNLIAPITNFSNERLSSTIFLGIFLTTCSLFIVSTLLPWRFMFLILGWAAIWSSHPAVISFVLSLDKQTIKEALKRAQKHLQSWIMEDIVLDEAPEMREVEVFELQRQRQGTEWEAWMYSPSPYDPQSPLRVSGDRPRGTRFFEDVQAPKGWEWSDKKWSLDLLSRDWVEERMITAVEVETEGERWVYDIGASKLLEGDSSKDNSKQKDAMPKKDWEEGSGLDPKGEWRRRRWVRLVKRQKVREVKDLRD